MKQDADHEKQVRHATTESPREDAILSLSVEGDQVQLSEEFASRPCGQCEGHEHESDFESFFRTEYPQVVKVVMYAGATFEEAEDAVSPAMAQAYPRWSVLRHPAAWVRVVALRNYFTKVKNDRRRSHAETAAGHQDCVDSSSAREHVEPEERNQVITVLRCLPPAQLTVMALTFDGYTPTEIAQMLDQDASTVRSNLRHARNRLRDEFEPSQQARNRC